MNNPPPSDPTIDYYRQNAAAFAGDTVGVDMQGLYAEFLPLIPPAGRILDAGCGPGRDSAHFQSLGFAVVAFDATPELAKLAEQAIGRPVRLMTFQDVDFPAEFDGVWACASLLHVPSGALDDALRRLTRSLKPGGVFYLSFKYGRDEGPRNGRFFNDHDEAKLSDRLQGHKDLVQMKVWITQDNRKGREHERWVNAVLRKA
jgi:SAM-dependent methyltransferase